MEISEPTSLADQPTTDLIEKAAGARNAGQGKVDIKVKHDHLFVYLSIDGKPVKMTLLTARELALALRRAANQVERGK